jgi:hypothetical protein
MYNRTIPEFFRALPEKWNRFSEKKRDETKN